MKLLRLKFFHHPSTVAMAFVFDTETPKHGGPDIRQRRVLRQDKMLAQLEARTAKGNLRTGRGRTPATPRRGPRAGLARSASGWRRSRPWVSRWVVCCSVFSGSSKLVARRGDESRAVRTARLSTTLKVQSHHYETPDTRFPRDQRQSALEKM